MRDRDFDYIESRLLAPATPLLDAMDRLRAVGHDDKADRLNTAAIELVDVCRDVRRELEDLRRAHSQGFREAGGVTSEDLAQR